MRKLQKVICALFITVCMLGVISKGVFSQTTYYEDTGVCSSNSKTDYSSVPAAGNSSSSNFSKIVSSYSSKESLSGPAQTPKYKPIFDKDRLHRAIMNLENIVAPNTEIKSFENFLEYDRTAIKNKEFEKLFYDAIHQKCDQQATLEMSSETFAESYHELYVALHFPLYKSIEKCFFTVDKVHFTTVKINYLKFAEEARAAYDDYCSRQKQLFSSQQEEYNKKLQLAKISERKIIEITGNMDFGPDEKSAVNAIVKYICDHCAYYYNNSESDHRGGINDCLSGSSVCEGYAKTFAAFLAYLDIDCKMVVGNNYSHAWNRVEIDNIDYFFDLTWYDSDRSKEYVWNRNTPKTHYLVNYTLANK